MTRRPGDQSPEPRGGRAAARLRQFLQARMPDAELGEDSGPASQDTGPGGEAVRAEKEEPEQDPASSEDRDEESSG